MDPKILVIGACGQIGSELTLKLKALYGNENVIASDIRDSNLEVVNSGVFEILDAQDFNSLSACIKKHEINTVYLMAAMLSATSEKSPMKAWDLNMNSLFHVLNLAKDKVIQKVFWPSSIAVFHYSRRKHRAIHHYRTYNRLWYYEIGWRALVRILPPKIRCRC